MTGFLPTVESADLVELVVRATLVLSVAIALQWLTRKGSAAARHHLWTVTFALLLLLPALRLFGPSWDVPLLPQAGGPEVSPLEVLESGTSVVSAGTPLAAPADVPEARGASAEAAQPRPFIQLAFLLWGLGSGAALVSVIAGFWRFRRLVRAGRPVECETWLTELDALRKRLSIRVYVRLVLGADSVMPMTGGLRRPVILLPASAANWSDARRRVVLSHELVHVRRHDALRQLLGRTVLSLYWFHPLTWVASHFAAVRREEACDEEVLAAGARPSDYARHLLSLAESSTLGQRALSLPMAQRSQLERRIRAILRPYRARPRAAVVELWSKFVYGG
ncbi:MAG: M56 family metallopeptidase [Acidobacteriota bacterium]|nr:M56 family metallopeptidase [Acidobacteriota bacterium]